MIKIGKLLIGKWLYENMIGLFINDICMKKDDWLYFINIVCKSYIGSLKYYGFFMKNVFMIFFNGFKVNILII